MTKIDYYMFDVHNPYRCGGDCYKTLGEAKIAYIGHIKLGHIIGSDIYGKSKKDDCVALTYTPWFSDLKSFGRTKLTWIGEAVKQGTYIL